MDRSEWDVRYSSEDLLWSANPNQFLVQEVEDLPAGTVGDVVCGEGRNAIWLARRDGRPLGGHLAGRFGQGLRIADE